MQTFVAPMFSIDEGSLPSEIIGVSPLARIYYGQTEAGPRVIDGVLELPVHMVTDGTAGFIETWHATGNVTVVIRGSVAVAHDGQQLVCAGFVPRHGRWADAIRQAYAQGIALADELGYANIFRMWNMIGHINETNQDGLEVYRDFCVGRAEAFDVRKMIDGVPSATGIGSRGDGISFYFLATRSGRITNLENPNQVPAFEYPDDYGPRPPSFARASTIDGADKLFISGTASILGHRTMHVGNIEKQLETTRDNLQALLRASEDDERGWQLEHVKVYVRHSRDLETVRRFVEQNLPTPTPPVYMNVAICRSDLLVEIEGVARR
ncbi:chorismatase, FkbO/Hyg5 family [Plantibacter flavus]|uniref:FkbO/Hyg5 family chorismatase n=1 Tax=Plantibacter flavus TaxID=150123 RepID=A0A3N2C7J0_9MICO|nr:FkbO/Hyg5 family chorismatase [Plantibacter flavus]ROR83485.1 FkbO/Hyg5 family chorismatase [Plantibacter flavus]SMG23940.1 chorismatase, FkbO/Hyg5 family [Plantibacter flavus]